MSQPILAVTQAPTYDLKPYYIYEQNKKLVKVYLDKGHGCDYLTH